MKRERRGCVRMGRSVYKDTEMKTGRVLKCNILRFNYKEQNPVQMAVARVILEEKGALARNTMGPQEEQQPEIRSQRLR